MTRALTKNTREELLSIAERQAARLTEMDVKVDGLEAALARSQGDYERVKGMWIEASRTRWWSVLGYVVGILALVYGCYLVGTGELAWPWGAK